jgi:hypothetical protein
MDAGSVDEHSSKSDEEYDDLAMPDVKNGEWSDDEQMVSSTKDSLALVSTPGTGIAEGDTMGSWYHHSLDLFLKMYNDADRPTLGTFVVSLCGANGRLVACSVCIQNEFTFGCKSGLCDRTTSERRFVD